jgi:hypothetical protein
MISFTAELLKYDQKSEKTGWTYIDVKAYQAGKLRPGIKKSYKVKGFLDAHPVKLVALIPIGDGDFILPVNQTMRKALGKKAGDLVVVQLEVDDDVYKISEELMVCITEDPKAHEQFQSLPASHQNYYSKWVESAKTDATKADRIHKVIYAMHHQMEYGEMIRHFRNR